MRRRKKGQPPRLTAKVVGIIRDAVADHRSFDPNAVFPSIEGRMKENKMKPGERERVWTFLNWTNARGRFMHVSLAVSSGEKPPSPNDIRELFAAFSRRAPDVLREYGRSAGSLPAQPEGVAENIWRPRGKTTP